MINAEQVHFEVNKSRSFSYGFERSIALRLLLRFLAIESHVNVNTGIMSSQSAVSNFTPVTTSSYRTNSQIRCLGAMSGVREHVVRR